MRMIIVSNRLPFALSESEKNISFSETTGGLASGIQSYLRSLPATPSGIQDHLWVGWPGDASPDHQEEIKTQMQERYQSYPVFLDEKTRQAFYDGFCNKTLWPLFHCFPERVRYDEKLWDSYKTVNHQYYETIISLIRPDDILWIHDYHLMLLPLLLRKERPSQQIGFFLHIPFPPIEIYRLLPKKWREALLRGLLGADLIGFHTHDYTQNFLKCLLRLLGYEHDLGQITLQGRIVKADTFPMGIDFAQFQANAKSKEVQQVKNRLLQDLKGIKTIFSMDRLDYTKGIINRLQGFEYFLEHNPDWHNRVTFILNVSPSRIAIDDYQVMKTKVDEYVGNINGRFGTISWTPMQYQYRYIPNSTLYALYSLCDVAMITPLRDGMNLIAKEYLASRIDKQGVLILSEMAGASRELGEALSINPNHKEEIADAIREALEMSPEEQQRRNSIMQERLASYNIIKWGNEFLQTLSTVSEMKKQFTIKLLTTQEQQQMIIGFKKAKKKILFLDYDGTLVPFKERPEEIKPDKDLLALLKTLTALPGVDVVLLSGRDRDTLQHWFDVSGLHLAAEHGGWIKEKDKDWQLIQPVTTSWKANLRPILQMYVDRLPGSFIEEKEFSLVWHYRKADPEQASIRVKELVDDLTAFTSNVCLQVAQGEKIVETKNPGIDKGAAGKFFLEKNQYDFILAIGDDRTDQDLFKILPEHAYSVQVGIRPSVARYYLTDYTAVRKLLQELSHE